MSVALRWLAPTTARWQQRADRFYKRATAFVGPVRFTLMFVAADFDSSATPRKESRQRHRYNQIRFKVAVVGGHPVQLA